MSPPLPTPEHYSSFSSSSSPRLEAGEGECEKVAAGEPVVLSGQDDDGLRTAADGASLRRGKDVLALQDLNPALNQKMHLVNNVSIMCLVVFWAKPMDPVIGEKMGIGKHVVVSDREG